MTRSNWMKLRLGGDGGGRGAVGLLEWESVSR